MRELSGGALAVGVTFAFACGASTSAPGGAQPQAPYSARSPVAAPGDRPAQEPPQLPPPVAAGEAKAPVPVVPPAIEGNPFVGARFYIDPAFVAKVESSIRSSPANGEILKKVEAFPTAIWLDSVKSVGAVERVLDDAARQQKKDGQPILTVFAVYDLPDRDCSAAASNGELSANHDGERRYQKEFIDKIAAAFRAHPKQRIVAIVEPDSLPNLATNLGVSKCAAAESVYRRSIAYAVRSLSMSNVSLYLDAAHAGWLGWSKNRERIATIFAQVLEEAGGPEKIRGFAINVSNYDTLTPGDLPKLEASDPATDELTYARILDGSLTEAGISGKAFIVDTSRNGRAGIRTKSSSWCNVKGAGLGERPRAAPGPLVDAYYWIKPPGDADGGSDPAAPGFDENCGPKSPDSEQGAPRAGAWFDKYFIELAKNANPPL